MKAKLLGNFQLSTESQPEIELRPTATRLFTFLLLNSDRRHLREAVATSFWKGTEIDLARKRLNTTLWQLRKALQGNRKDNCSLAVIEATPTHIEISREVDIWLDVTAFEESAASGLAYLKAEKPLLAALALDDAVNFYNGDLLDGFYDDWILRERDRLCQVYMRCLSSLLAIYQQHNNVEGSILYAQRILRIEPWREDIHQTLISLYSQNGQRSNAIAQYYECRNILASELAVLPMAKTEALYRSLLTYESESVKHDSDYALTLQEATHQLNIAIQNLQLAQTDLNRAVDVVKHLKNTSAH